MEVYKLVFKHYLLDTKSKPIISLFDIDKLVSPISEPELYYIESKGFRVYYHRTNETKIIYIYIDFKSEDKEYEYYFNYVREFKRDENIDDIPL